VNIYVQKIGYIQTGSSM